MYLLSCDYDDRSSKGWSRIREVFIVKSVLGVLGKSTHFAPNRFVISILETDQY